MIPTMTNVDHVCFTVPDLEQAMHFFTDVLGAKELFTVGPVSIDAPSVAEGEETGDPDWMYNQLRMHPRTVLTAGLMQLGPTMTLELYEVDAPGMRTEHVRPHDIGAPHLSFRVKDMDAAVEYLRAHPDVTLHGEPQGQQGPIEGMRWLHFESPWGLVLEVDEWPTTKMPYEDETDGRLTPAQDSWDPPRA